MYLETFRQYTEWHDEANRRQYEAPADPWALVDVDPQDLEFYNGEPALHLGLGRVQGGEWDRGEHCHPLRETALYRGLEQRFEEGRDWEETALYRRMADRFEDAETVRGYDSLAEYREVRLPYVDELYESIAEEGYRPNEAAKHEKASEDNPMEDAYANHLEPVVVIGRDGAIHLAEGIHRVSLASILDLDAVPVYVLCRHAEWQATRDRFATAAGELPADLRAYADHPDLRNLS